MALGTASPHATGAEFQAAAWNAQTDRAAVLRLPEGTRRVRVQSRASAASPWQLVGLTHLPGPAGTLKVRLPDGVALDNILIETSDTDPFPYGFYAGQTTFSNPSAGGPGGQVRADAFAPNADAGNGAETAPSTQTVEESDIWKWRDRTLYYFNSLRGLQVFDFTDAAAPKRVTSLRLPAVGEDMYLIGPEHVALLVNRYDANYGTETSEIRLIRHRGSSLEETTRIPVDGRFVESRLVGSMLCVVSQRTEAVTDPTKAETTYHSKTQVLAVDLADPSSPRVRGKLDLPNPDGVWSWRTVIHATLDFLFVSTDAWTSSLGYRSILHAIDLRTPDQPLGISATFPIGGHLQSKFHLSYDGGNGILTTVTQADGAKVETWDVRLALLGTQPGLPRPLDSLVVGHGERLFGTRFDGDRVHVVTFRQIDPLFCIDLSDPRDLRMLGELEVPGFSTYLEAFADGTRLLSLGVEDFRVAVSLFDVADPSRPSLTARLRFGDEHHGSWSEGNYDDKAIGFFREAGLLAFPLSSWSSDQGYRQGMQLVDVTNDGLQTRGFIAHRFNARRARLVGHTLVSISGTELTVVDVANRDQPLHLSTLDIAWPVDALLPADDVLVQAENGDSYQWNSAQPLRHARLRITPKSDPESTLSVLDLDLPGDVAGVARRGTVVTTLLQLNAQREVVPDPTDPATKTWEFVRTLTTLTIDIADPAAPKITGRATSEKTETGWNWGGSAMRAHWLPDGRLLWYPTEVSGGGFWLRCLACDIAVPAGGAFVDALWPWWGSAASDYLIVDLADVAAPRVIVRESLVPESTQSGGGRAFISAPDRLLVSWNGWSSKDGQWTEEIWVQEIDLNDPARPSRTPPASLPGTLQGSHRTSAGGQILFTSRPETTPGPNGFPNWTGHALIEALAYDGSQAFLLDAIRAEHSAHASAVTVGRHLLLTKPRLDWSPASPAGSSLHVIAWNESTGKLTALEPLPVAANYPSLQAEGGFVFVSGGTFVDVLAAHQLPDPPARARFDLHVNSWYSSSAVLDAPSRSAWWKAGLYGVDHLDLSTLSFPAPAPRIARRDSPTAEWVAATWSSVAVVAARATAYPGPLQPDADFRFIADSEAESFDAWSTRWFGHVVSPLADDDADGFDAYSEWALGSSPRDGQSTPNIGFEVLNESGQPPRIALIAHFNPLATVGQCAICSYLELAPQVSTDLRTWSRPDESGVEVIDSVGRRILIVRPANGAPTSFFARLRPFFVIEG